MKSPFHIEKIPIIECRTISEFETHVKPNRQPVVMRGFIDDWVALQLWDFDYLRDALRDSDLDVYQSSDRFFPGEYRASPDGKTKICDGRKTTGMKGDDFFKKLLDPSKERYYLHAFELPQMLADQVGGHSFDSFFARRFLWLSAAEHVTPIHFDSSDNILAQIVGEKSLLLFDPRYFDEMYLYGCDHRYSRHSQVFDITNIDFKYFPKLENITGFQASLKPGDALFIPNFWWHHAESRSFSASVNTWWNADPLPNFDELITKWLDLRADLFNSLPSSMSPRYKAYFARVLLFSDIP